MTKNELKKFISLKNKKNRRIYSLFLVEGIKAVKDLIESDWEIEAILITNELNENLEYSISPSIRVEIISNLDMSRISDSKSPQGIIAIAKFPKKNMINVNKPIVALYKINDPGNVGTIIRTCDWFGINNIIIGEESADIYNPKTVRATMGSLFHVNIRESKNIIEDIKLYSDLGYNIYCADLNGVDLNNIAFPQKSILILSSEAHGPSDELISLSDYKVTIPRIGRAESLNVAISGGIIISRMI